jgi:hypothetical protein
VLAAWVLANLLVLLVVEDTLPFDRPLVAGNPLAAQVIGVQLGLLLALALMGVVYALTRNRVVPDVAARAPVRPVARLETCLMLGYAVLGQLGGFALGRAAGWHPISLHLVGTLYGTHEVIQPFEILGWAGYNFAVYALVPYLVFRRRGYSREALNLTSSDRGNDAMVIVVILVLESAAEIFGLSSAVLGLSRRQLLLGAPLSFLVNLVGTVLPIMVFIYGILIPRFLKLTESVVTTVALGGLTYALMHFFDGWTVYDSPGHAVLSIIFLLFQYFGPGMVKTILTLRTGNAWVHVWAYHALAPHVTVDTVNLVHALGIK